MNAPSSSTAMAMDQSKSPYGDPEMALYPNIDLMDNAMRWAFIRKVYSILSMQLVLTVIIGAVVTFVAPATHFVQRNPWLVIVFAILPLIMNLFLLTLFTATMSLTLGISCAYTGGRVVLESAILTCVVVICLTLYTFWAASRGQDFSFLGPILFAGLMILILFALIQIFLPLGKLSHMIYGGIASLIFSAYIVYDTDNLIKRYSYDEYIWASVALYLDIINLFLSLLTLLRD